MNQPTREEFEKFKQEVRDEIRQEFRQLFEHRQTEEMPAINVNVASEDVLKKLDAIGQTLEKHTSLLQEISKGLLIHSKAINALQTDVAALPSREDLAAMEARLVGTMMRLLEPKSNGH